MRGRERSALRVQSLKPVAKDQSADNGQVLCPRPLRCRCELSCSAGGQRRRPVAGPLAVDERGQAKARLCFPFRDLARSEYNSGGRSHRTAWADSR